MNSGLTFRTVVVTACTMLLGCTGSSPRFTLAKSESSSTIAAPSSTSSYEEGVASYYADEFNGRMTSNGETFDMHELTAAHRTLPFNTKVRVTNLVNGRFVVVRINDRGPFKDDRIIDLSLAGAKEIGLISSGTAKVRVEVLEWGDGKRVKSE